MVSTPAAPARMLRRALTIVAGVVLVLLAWTSSAGADDAPATDARPGILGGVAEVLDDTTHQAASLLDASEHEAVSRSGSPSTSDSVGRAQSADTSAPREAPTRGARVVESVVAPAAPVTEALAAVAEPVVEPALEATRPLTEPAAEQVERVVAPVRDAVRPVTSQLRPVLEPVGAALEPVEQTLSPVGDLLDPVTVVLRPVADIVEGIALPTPLVPSEPTTVVPDDGSGPVRPIPATTQAPTAEGVTPSAERGSFEHAGTIALVEAQSVSISSIADVPGSPSPDEDRGPAPVIPAAATGSGASSAGAGSGGPATAALSDVWTPSAALALDRPCGRSTTLLTVAPELPGFAPD